MDLDIDNCCSICLEDNNENTTKTLDCGHKFHEECINGWKNLSKKCYYTCPICQEKYFKRYCNNISNCSICFREYCRNVETIINIPPEITENNFNKNVAIYAGTTVFFVGIVSIIILSSFEKN